MPSSWRLRHVGVPLNAVSLRARFEHAARVIAEHRDVLDARPADGEAPPALHDRGWVTFLASLDDAELASIEIGAHDAEWSASTPSSLRVLVEQVRETCNVPASTVTGDVRAASRHARRNETPRKRAQVDAFSRLILPLATSAERVVDVGSGHGHLTREIAERIARPVVGLERDDGLTVRARELSLEGAGSPSFAVTDVLAEGIPIVERDCVIGLHACGDLGDAMVESVARVRASIALVGCCLQKRRALSRRPLCGSERAELHLPRSILGLSNLTARDDGVEATRLENLAGRERRLALHRLLSESGIELRLGAEIEGLNRRAAQSDLPLLVARAFAVRGLVPPPRARIEEAATWARTQHARARRLALPRALLARVLEVFVLLDRALYLEERGFEVAVGTAFPVSVSARNLVLLGKC